MKKAKQFISVFLVTALMICSFTWISVFNSGNNVDAENKISNMNFTIRNNSGTESDPYEISTEKDLIELSNTVNRGENYRGKYFLLKNDIKITSLWTPIGTSTSPFCGTFSGAYHKITINKFNKTLISSATYENRYVGLFGFIDGGVVQKLNLQSSSEIDFNTKYRGLLAGKAVNTEFKYITVDMKFKENHDLSVEGAISDYSYYFGGICGRAENCTLDGLKSIGSYTYNSNATQIKNVYSGGICGYAKNSTIKNCINSARLEQNSSFTGGICGYAEDTTINYSKNQNHVLGAGYAGGIAAGLCFKDLTDAEYSYLSCASQNNTEILIGSSDAIGCIVNKNSGGGKLFNLILFGNEENIFNVTMRYNYATAKLQNPDHSIGGLYGFIDTSLYNLSDSDIYKAREANITLGNSFVIFYGGELTNDSDYYTLTKDSSIDYPCNISTINDAFDTSTVFSNIECTCGYAVQTNESSFKSSYMSDYLNRNSEAFSYEKAFITNLNENSYPSLYSDYFDGGNGSEENPFIIRSQTQLTENFHLCRSNSELNDMFNKASYIVVSSELYFNGNNEKTAFSGHFNGDFNTFKKTNSTYFLDKLSEEGIVENIVFSETHIVIRPVLTSYAIIANTNYGTIKNILSYINISFPAATAADATNAEIDIGLVAGTNYGNISQCVNAGNIEIIYTEFFPRFGFISGQNFGTITDCYNVGDILITSVRINSTSIYSVGGIVSYNSANATLKNCYFAGKIEFNKSVNKDSIAVDPICSFSGSSISNCYFNNTITDFVENYNKNSATQLSADEMVTLPGNGKPTGMDHLDENIWYFKECDETTNTFYYPQLNVFKNVAETSVYLNKVTFKAMTGNEDDDFIRYYMGGTAIQQPENPYYGGHSLQGWYCDTNYDRIYNFKTEMDGNINLYAKWSLDAPVVSIITNKENNTTYIGDHLIMSLNIDSKATNARVVEYMWHRTDNAIILNRTLSTYIVSNFKESATYYCEITYTDGKDTIKVKSNEVKITINKLIPDVLTPVIDGNYTTKDTLGDVKLPAGWTWEEDADTSLTRGENFRYAIYTPDSDNYETVRRIISFDVSDNTILLLLCIFLPLLFLILLLLIFLLLWLLYFKKYSLYFVTCGGNEIKPYKLRKNSRIIYPVPQKPNMEFAGWFTDGTYKNFCELERMPNQNIVLYAKWYYSYNNLIVTKQNYNSQDVKLIAQSNDANISNLSDVNIVQDEVLAAVDAKVVKNPRRKTTRHISKNTGMSDTLSKPGNLKTVKKQKPKAQAVIGRENNITINNKDIKESYSDVSIINLKTEEVAEKVKVSKRPKNVINSSSHDELASESIIKNSKKTSYKANSDISSANKNTIENIKPSEIAKDVKSENTSVKTAPKKSTLVKAKPKKSATKSKNDKSVPLSEKSRTSTSAQALADNTEKKVSNNVATKSETNQKTPAKPSTTVRTTAKKPTNKNTEATKSATVNKKTENISSSKSNAQDNTKNKPAKTANTESSKSAKTATAKKVDIQKTTTDINVSNKDVKPTPKKSTSASDKTTTLKSASVKSESKVNKNTAQNSSANSSNLSGTKFGNTEKPEKHIASQKSSKDVVKPVQKSESNLKSAKSRTNSANSKSSNERLITAKSVRNNKNRVENNSLTKTQQKSNIIKDSNKLISNGTRLINPRAIGMNDGPLMEAVINKESVKVYTQKVDNPTLIKTEPKTRKNNLSTYKKYSAGTQTIETTKYTTIETTEYYYGDEEFTDENITVENNLQSDNEIHKTNNNSDNIVMEKIKFKD